MSEDRYAPIFEAPVKKLNFVNGQFEFSWNGRWFKTLEAAQAAQTVAFQELRDRGVDVAERLGEVEARYTAHIAEMDEVIKAAVDSGDWSNVPADVIRHKAIGIIVSSLPYVAKRKVSHEIEFISAECVYGMHFFKDVFAGIRDFWGGGRSAATQKVLRDARRVAITELRREALLVGADAVLGVSLDYHEMTGGGKNGMIMLVAAGTAVKLEEVGE